MTNYHLVTIVRFIIFFYIVRGIQNFITFLGEYETRVFKRTFIIKDNVTTLSEVEMYEEILIKKLTENNGIYCDWILLNSIHNKFFPYTLTNLISFNRPESVREIVKGAGMNLNRLETYIDHYLYNYHDVEFTLFVSLFLTILFSRYALYTLELFSRVVLKEHHRI